MPDPNNHRNPEMDRLGRRPGVHASPGDPGAGVDEVAEERKGEIERLRRQLATEREALADARAELAGREAPVFFVMGRAKSGTSWLMRILDAHPEILCRGEGRFFGRDHARDVPDKARMSEVRNRSLYGALADSEYLRAWIERSVWRGDADAEEHLNRLTALAIDHFLKGCLSESDKRIVGDKTPFTGTEVVGEVARIRPDAKLIHVIRDGRDVAVSSIHHVWNNARQEGGIHELTPEELTRREAYRSDPEGFVRSGESIFTERRLFGTARSWTEMVGRAVEDGPKLLGENYAEVRYEDLLRRPEQETRRLLGFLGADASGEVVERCVESASFERRTKGRKRGQEDAASFFRKGVAGDWRGVFTGRDREVFKEEAGELLIKLGYEENLDW